MSGIKKHTPSDDSGHKMAVARHYSSVAKDLW